MTKLEAGSGKCWLKPSSILMKESGSWSSTSSSGGSRSSPSGTTRCPRPTDLKHIGGGDGLKGVWHQI